MNKEIQASQFYTEKAKLSALLIGKTAKVLNVVGNVAVISKNGVFYEVKM